MLKRTFAAVAAATLLSSAPLLAQEAVAPVLPEQALSISPLLAVFGVYSGEYERVIGETSTIAIGASHFSFGDEEEFDDGTSAGGEIGFNTFDLKYRYWPSATPLQGFAIGGIVGMTVITGDVWADDGNGTVEESGSLKAANLGLDLNYSWLLGKRDSFFVGTGIGAKRVIFFGDNVSENVTGYLPTGRIAVGYAF